MEVVLGATERHLKCNAIVRCSQPGFTKTKYFLTNLISFYDKIIQVLDERKGVDVVNSLQMPKITFQNQT